jgi:hypothetical protein
MSIGFTVFLNELRDGRAHSELSMQLAELITQVKETGKGGELILKLKIKPASRGGEVEKVTISDQITTNLPKHERGEDFFYLNDDNELTRQHPKQQALDLRQVIQTQPAILKQAKAVQ